MDNFPYAIYIVDSIYYVKEIDAAKILGISRQRVSQLALTGKLPYINRGSLVLIPIDSIWERKK